MNAHRWTRLNRLRETEGIEDEPLLGVWNSATFPEDDRRHGWTSDDCWNDAVVLLGSEDAVREYVAGKPEEAQQSGEDEKPFQLRNDLPRLRQGRLF